MTTGKFFNSISYYIKNFYERECSSIGCKRKRLGYGEIGGEQILCKEHYNQFHGAVKLEARCRFINCETKGTYSIKESDENGAPVYKFCASHRDTIIERNKVFNQSSNHNLFINSPSHTRCKHESKNEKGETERCPTGASFQGYCKEHSDGRKSSDSRKCKVNGCTDTRRPRFGFKTPTHCKKHGLEKGMIDLSGTKCKSCTRRASYRENEDSPLEYCVECKPSHYILCTKECKTNNCVKQPTYGKEGTNEYTHCSEHGKVLGYVDNKNKKCEDCDKNATFGDEGVRRWCLDHSRDGSINLVEILCVMECCSIGHSTQVKYFHPRYKDKESEFYGRRICSFSRRIIIEQSIHDDDNEKTEKLLEHFGMKNKKITTINAQSAFFFYCEKECRDRLRNCTREFDNCVHGGRKAITNKRPDVFYKWVVNGKGYGIQIEYDEKSNHEDNDDRLQKIEQDSNCTGGVYIIRVYGKHDSDNPLCEKHVREFYQYYSITNYGEEIAKKVSLEIIKRIDCIQEGTFLGDKKIYI